MQHREWRNEYFSLTRPVEFAQIYPLPATKTEPAIFERHGNARADERRFDVGVGIVFEVLEIRLVLRDQPFQKAEHVTLYVRIGIFIYCQPARRVLGEENADPITLGQMRLDLRSNIDHLLAFRRCGGYEKHMKILPQSRRDAE